MEEIWIWHGGPNGSQLRTDDVYLAADGAAFPQAPDVSLSRTCAVAYTFEDVTFVHRFPEPVQARHVKVVSDQGSDTTGDWTELREVAVMAPLPANPLSHVPSWALPEGSGLSGAPVVLVAPASWSGHNPPGWPDPEARWVWTLAGANSDAPFGTTRFRVLVDLPARTAAAVSVAADDRASVWVDGRKLWSWNRAGYWAAAPVILPPGRHVLAFECENSGNVAGPNASPAGLLVSVCDLAGTVLARSGGSGWQAENVCPEWAQPGNPAPGVPVKLLAQCGTSPDPAAWKVWVEPGTLSGAPAGEVGFRAEFDVAETVDGTLYVAADDRVTVWLDGVCVGHSHGGTFAALPVQLRPGRHVLALHAANAVVGSNNPGWVAATLKDASGRVVLRTGDPCWSSAGYLMLY